MLQHLIPLVAQGKELAMVRDYLGALGEIRRAAAGVVRRWFGGLTGLGRQRPQLGANDFVLGQQVANIRARPFGFTQAGIQRLLLLPQLLAVGSYFGLCFRHLFPIR